jgi:tetratricopeptide (TPR) repeat protein
MSASIGLLILAAVLSNRHDLEPRLDGLGPHRRAVTTRSGDAQAYFDQGLNLLYAFNHDEAIRSFRQAAALDPGCAMAWWGVAYASGPHVNRPMVDASRNRAALEAIAKARAAIDDETPVERALIEALGTRYADPNPEDRRPLDEAFARAMREVWQSHPTDADVGALHAESLMDLRPWDLWTQDGQPQPGTDEVLDTLERVGRLNPDHPLALHLTIHALEASPHPERAKDAADRLRYLQPGLAHNVHMPSHIDVRTGDWREAEAANERAIAADRAYRSIRPRQGFFRLYMLHNDHMLAYAAMMRGRSARAIRAIDESVASIPTDWLDIPEMAAIGDGYLAMPLEARVRFGRWDEILAAPEPDERFPLARALRHAARGIALAALGRVEEAESERAAFAAAKDRIPETASFGLNRALDLAAVAEKMLEGEVLYRAGRVEPGLAALGEAVAREDRLRYSEPPDWIIPVRHALGAALMREGRHAEAEAVYREDLRRLPRNGWSLYGLAAALDGQGRRDEAASVRRDFETVWADADLDLTSSCVCLPADE